MSRSARRQGTAERPRVFARDPSSRRGLEMVGLRRWDPRDGYYFLVKASWPVFMGLLLLAFISANALFALGYVAVGGVANLRPFDFTDAFFFSVQTLATTGYGQMYPTTLTAHLLVTAESFTGLVGLAVATGLIFAKFSRPRARVIFSEVAAIAPRDGVPTLMFRVANARGNHVVEAHLKVAMLQTAVTKEGQRFRMMRDLPLVRSESPAFILSWTAMHPVDEQSPLYGATKASLAEDHVEILVTFAGLDGTLMQTIHARHSYQAEDLRWNEQLADVFELLPDGRRRVDHRKFHQTIPVGPPTPEDPPAPRSAEG